MVARKRKPVEANDGSYGGAVLAAFDALSECDKCDGTGTQCNACNAGILDCNCGPDAEPCSCEQCAGTGSKQEN